MAKISITRALVELTRLGERITQATSAGIYVSRTQGKNDKRKVVNSNVSVQDTEKLIQASFDKVESLVRNREALKAAIVLSNATTKVVVAGREMTVAEAIELKTSITYKQCFLNALRAQYVNTKNLVEKENATLEAEINKLLTTAYGSDKTKIEPSIVSSISDPQLAAKQQELLDPSGIEAKIQKLDEEVSAVKSELDFVLSESNARTEIEVVL